MSFAVSGDQRSGSEGTVYVGNLDSHVNEEILAELMIQVAPIEKVHIPKDKLTGTHSGYGFVDFFNVQDADYACRIMNGVKLYGQSIRVNRSANREVFNAVDVGANLFIGNLDPEVDERVLYDAFQSFGRIIAQPKIMRDPLTNLSKGFGFISFDSFEASDAAIEAMNNQYIMNRPISVGYALKKGGQGERHGTPAERLIAEKRKKALPASAQKGPSVPPPPPIPFHPPSVPLMAPPSSAFGFPGASPYPGHFTAGGGPPPGMSFPSAPFSSPQFGTMNSARMNMMMGGPGPRMPAPPGRAFYPNRTLTPSRQ